MYTSRVAGCDNKEASAMDRMTRFQVVCMNKLHASRHRKGATMVEYGLMVALIAFVLITVVSLMGKNLLGTFTEIANNLQGKKP